MTRAPNTISCATFGSGANSGTKMTAVRPTAAAAPASDEAALPVDAQATTRARAAMARVTPTALARSLNDAVGFRPSSLTRSDPTPAHAARRGALVTGVQPTGSGGVGPRADTGSSSRYRQMSFARDFNARRLRERRAARTSKTISSTPSGPQR